MFGALVMAQFWAAAGSMEMNRTSQADMHSSRDFIRLMDGGGWRVDWRAAEAAPSRGPKSRGTRRQNSGMVEVSHTGVLYRLVMPIFRLFEFMFLLLEFTDSYRQTKFGTKKYHRTDGKLRLPGWQVKDAGSAA